MISLELLRRYSFFAGLDEAELKSLAMISEQVRVPAGTILFEEGQNADALYLLLEGSVDLSFNSSLGPIEQVHVGEVNPGEPFSISALIPPHLLTHTARAGTTIHTIKIAAAPLRALCQSDARVGSVVMRKVAEAAMERLHFTRVQLAAAQT
ncbi:MAG: Crp/Fnr family transcriptional regulator [Chloroflexi bacterium]|nr:Crp/Fnr family transcriptional regulator [Chloroflexota bacterium]